MKPIAKILAFYMFIGSLIPNSDFSRLIHLPDLVEHFQIHLEEAADQGGSFTIFDFLNIHYFNPNDHQHDGHDDHDNCPFQFFHAFTTFTISTVEFHLRGLPFSLATDNPSYKNAFYLKGFVTTEIQPPSVS